MASALTHARNIEGDIIMNIVEYYFMLFVAIILIALTAAYQIIFRPATQTSQPHARADQRAQRSQSTSAKHKQISSSIQPPKMKSTFHPDAVIQRNYFYPAPRMYSNFIDAFPPSRFVPIVPLNSTLTEFVMSYDTRPPGPMYFSDSLFWKVLYFLASLHTRS